MFKVLSNDAKGLWVYKVNGDDFESAANIKTAFISGPIRTEFTISNWRNLSPNDLSTILSNMFGMWNRDVIVDQSKYSLEDLTVPPGNYHPNIYRPKWTHVESSSGLNKIPTTVPSNFQNHLTIGIRRMARKLEGLLEHIEPDTANLSAYGSTTREFLNLCCNEIEGALKGVLKANGYSGKPKNWSMLNDYYKCEGPLRLSQYEVIYGDRISSMKPCKPFSLWSGKTFHPLEFYIRYNKVKHDPLANLQEATLGACIQSYSALVTLGLSILGSQHLSENCKEAGRFFEQIKQPTFDLKDYYITDNTSGVWTKSKISI